MKTPVNAGRIRSTGSDLHIGLDYNIQEYAEQAAKKAMEKNMGHRECFRVDDDDRKTARS